jgi:hypothetical protein
MPHSILPLALNTKDLAAPTSRSLFMLEGSIMKRSRKGFQVWRTAPLIRVILTATSVALLLSWNFLVSAILMLAILIHLLAEMASLYRFLRLREIYAIAVQPDGKVVTAKRANI